jgi:hypothetical protein
MAAGEDPSLWGGFRHAVTRFRLAVQVYGLLLNGERSARQKQSPASAPPKPAAEDGVLQGKQGDTSTAGHFCVWQPLKYPVSNLVHKSLTLAAKTIV